MDDRQPVHQHRHVIANLMPSAVFLVLVDDLQPVVVHVLRIEDHQVRVAVVVELEVKPSDLLELGRLLDDVVARIGQHLAIKALPLPVAERSLPQRHMIELLHLHAQVRDKVTLLRQRVEVLVALTFQNRDELTLKLRLRLVRPAPDLQFGHVLVHHCELRTFRQSVVVHVIPPCPLFAFCAILSSF